MRHVTKTVQAKFVYENYGYPLPLKFIFLLYLTDTPQKSACLRRRFFYHNCILFQFNGSGWLTGEIIQYAVDPFYFIDDPAHDFI